MFLFLPSRLLLRANWSIQAKWKLTDLPSTWHSVIPPARTRWTPAPWGRFATQAATFSSSVSASSIRKRIDPYRPTGSRSWRSGTRAPLWYSLARSRTCGTTNRQSGFCRWGTLRLGRLYVTDYWHLLFPWHNTNNRCKARNQSHSRTPGTMRGPLVPSMWSRRQGPR